MVSDGVRRGAIYGSHTATPIRTRHLIFIFIHNLQCNLKYCFSEENYPWVDIPPFFPSCILPWIVTFSSNIPNFQLLQPSSAVRIQEPYDRARGGESPVSRRRSILFSCKGVKFVPLKSWKYLLDQFWDQGGRWKNLVKWRWGAEGKSSRAALCMGSPRRPRRGRAGQCWAFEPGPLELPCAA